MTQTEMFDPPEVRSDVLGELVLDRAHGQYGRAEALFSLDRTYRYQLSRCWELGPRIHFCMLNPSTADALKLDPTVTNCVKFARREGFGELIVTNLFPLRTPKPEVMKKAFDPVGPEDLADQMILAAALASKRTVVAWGRHGKFKQRDMDVLRMFRKYRIEMYRMGDANKDGTPRHPLYLADSTPMVPFGGEET